MPCSRGEAGAHRVEERQRARTHLPALKSLRERPGSGRKLRAGERRRLTAAYLEEPQQALKAVTASACDMPFIRSIVFCMTSVSPLFSFKRISPESTNHELRIALRRRLACDVCVQSHMRRGHAGFTPANDRRQHVPGTAAIAASLCIVRVATAGAPWSRPSPQPCVGQLQPG